VGNGEDNFVIQIIGWIVWCIIIFLAISWAYSVRIYVKSGKGVHWATATQTLFLWIISALFLIFNWNKLHILWVAPISFFLAQLLVIGGVPILTPIVLFATRAFLKLILFGIKG
jgi:hypothetical protein